MKYDVFLSYWDHDEDRSFARITSELLNYHGVAVFRSSESLHGGSEWKSEIESSLRESSHLAVVGSSRTPKSKWVKHEILRFSEIHPERLILPLRLEPIDLSSIDSRLVDYQSIDFFEDQFGGYKKLWSALGRDFLPRDKIVVPNRRRGEDRRSSKGDRRQGPIDERVRRSIWHAYQSHTGDSKFEDAGSLYTCIFKIRDRVHDHLATSFSFHDEAGSEVEVKEALDAACEATYRQLDGRSPIKIIYVADTLGSKLTSQFTVRNKDRRKLQERRSVE